jgi:NADH-quinone oxidoreductase subunit C
MADQHDPQAAAEGEAETPGPELLHGCPLVISSGRPVLHVGRDQYIEVMKKLADDGYLMCHDVCGVDYLTHPGRTLPDGIEAERFEVVVTLQSYDPPRRLSIRTQVPDDDPVVPTLFDIWPGAEAMEREAFDLVGIRFDGHPDLTRILMPEDWLGHPLRKDYELGRIPVQFKAAPEARR